jgi:hypothetical protein
MASEAPVEQGKPPKKMPVLGFLLGLFVGAVALWVTLNYLLEAESTLQNPFLWQILYLIGMYVGGGIGGLIQLRKQGRAAEVPSFFRLLLVAALSLSLLFGSMSLATWLGERLHGRVGYWVGLLGSGLLWFLIECWRHSRSSSEKSPAPPPASG